MTDGHVLNDVVFVAKSVVLRNPYLLEYLPVQVAIVLRLSVI